MVSLSRPVISFLQLSHFLMSIVEEDLYWRGLELCDADLVLL